MNNKLNSQETNGKMNIPSIKEIVKNNKVTFDHYRANIMYYTVTINDQVNMNTYKYMFPVRLDDIGDATLLQTDKAIIFMRYIRKAIDTNEFVFIPNPTYSENSGHIEFNKKEQINS